MYERAELELIIEDTLNIDDLEKIESMKRDQWEIDELNEVDPDYWDDLDDGELAELLSPTSID